MIISRSIREILPHYFATPTRVQFEALGEGNINNTFLARSPQKTLVLQQINNLVFPDPELLICNLHQVNLHLQGHKHETRQRWEDVLLVPTKNGRNFVRDSDKNLWRALSYIDNSISVTTVQTTLQAKETGWALGRFHTRLATLATHCLAPPLPNFHLLSSYLNIFYALTPTVIASNKVQFCYDFIHKHKNTALILEQAANAGKISKAIIHGDPKIGNILFDQKTGKAVSIIDLDTTGPGFLQHDIGDCLRSICNKTGESSSTNAVEFDLTLCGALLKGYLDEAGSLLTTVDLEYTYNGLQAITFELGLRFFIDYLQGNVYFKCSYFEENLQKALTQFRLFQDILKKESLIRSLMCK